MRPAILLAVLLSASSASAAKSGNVEITGKVTNFNEKMVTFDIDGTVLNVPRKAFGDADLRPGKILDGTLGVDEFWKLIRSPASAPRRK